eukprot:1320339-Amorphochlora_amoeboformis.AAC.1
MHIGADIAKIAVLTRSVGEVIRVLSLYDLDPNMGYDDFKADTDVDGHLDGDVEYDVFKADMDEHGEVEAVSAKNRRVVALGMGESGIITRLAALSLGAPFTFVCGNQ